MDFRYGLNFFLWLSWYAIRCRQICTTLVVHEPLPRPSRAASGPLHRMHENREVGGLVVPQLRLDHGLAKSRRRSRSIHR